MMTLILVGAGMAIALVVGSAGLAARQAAATYRDTKARLPVLKKARNGAWLRAAFWIVVMLGFYLALVHHELGSSS